MHNLEKIKEKFKIENHLIYIDDNILYVISGGNTNEDGNEKTVNKIKEILLQILKSRPKLNIYVDMNKAGKTTPETRKISKEIMDYEQIEKIAFVGIHMVARIIAEFLIRFSGNKKARFFSSEKEALKWLNTDSL